MPRKTALVTGSAGFIGRHVQRELEDRGWYVHGWDISEGNDAWQLVTDFAVRQFDLVVHAAAADPHRRAIDTQPQNMVADLALDTAVFEWALRTEQRALLYLSSSAVYPVRYQTPYHVGTLLQEDLVKLGDRDRAASLDTPDSRYGFTKLVGEWEAVAARAAGLRVHVVRPFSGYGADQSKNFPFRAFLERARHRNDPFEVWGTTRQVRDWVHVDDVVNAALAVYEQDVRVPVNVCTGVGTSLGDLARLITEAAGYSPELRTEPDAPQGVFHRVGDPARLHEIYVPKISVAEGVLRAVTEAGL